MRKIWIVEYEALGEEKTRSFESFNSAKLFARKLISKYSEAPKYLDDLRNGHRKKYRTAIADFFEKYFNDPHFPYTEADIPTGDASDYEETAPEGMIFGDDLEEDDNDTDYEYESPDEYFEEDEFFACIGDGNDWMNTGDFEQCDLPAIETNLILARDENKTYKYNEDTLSIKIYKKLCTGGSSNPVLILAELKCGYHINPENYKDDDEYEEAYGVGEKAPMSMRTVYRHIKMLRDLGYVIAKKEDGFSLEGKTAPKRDVVFGTSAYPIMLLDVLEEAEKPLLQEDIINAILKKYHVSIHRKAIGRLIKGLIELGYDIEHTREGYKLNQP